MVDDKDLKKAEGEQRGRKGRDGELSSKKMLGKRSRNRNDDDSEMESDDSDHDKIVDKNIRGSLGKNKRSMTPVQRKISVKKVLRDRTASRREGTEPKRLDYKIVPEEQIRLAKKINAAFKHKIQKTEADRTISVKRPKHLFAGKMSNGKKDYR